MKKYLLTLACLAAFAGNSAAQEGPCNLQRLAGSWGWLGTAHLSIGPNGTATPAADIGIFDVQPEGSFTGRSTLHFGLAPVELSYSGRVTVLPGCRVAMRATDAQGIVYETTGVIAENGTKIKWMSVTPGSTVIGVGYRL